MDWLSALVGMAAPSLTFLGVWLTLQGNRAKDRAAEDKAMADRMDALESKLDRIQSHLRAEQRFSHRLILSVQRLIFFLREEADWRAAHDMPGTPPIMPSPEDLEEALEGQPIYNPGGGK